MKLSLSEKAILDNTGWLLAANVFKTTISIENSLLNIATTLGTPVPMRAGEPLVSVLRLTDRAAAKSNSLSSMYGTGAFPFHCDTAHWRTPCKFVIFYCLNPGKFKRPTLLINLHQLNFSKEELEFLKQDLFMVRNGRNSFFSPILIDNTGRFRIRFDEHCMIPACPSSRRTLGLVRQKLVATQPLEINWQSGDLLIVNNSIMLHGRAFGHPDDRKLCRTLVLE